MPRVLDPKMDPTDEARIGRRPRDTRGPPHASRGMRCYCPNFATLHCQMQPRPISSLLLFSNIYWYPSNGREDLTRNIRNEKDGKSLTK